MAHFLTCIVPHELQDYGFVDFAQPSAAVAAKSGLEKRSSGKFGSTAAPEPAKPAVSLRKATMTVAEKKEQERKEEAAKANTAAGAAADDAVATVAADAVAANGDATAAAAEGSAPAATTEAEAPQPAEGAADAGAALNDASTAPAPGSPVYQAVGTAAADAKPVQRPHGQVKLLQVGSECIRTFRLYWSATFAFEDTPPVWQCQHRSKLQCMQVEWAAPRSVPPLFSRILYVGNLRPVRGPRRHMLCDNTTQYRIAPCSVWCVATGCRTSCEKSKLLACRPAGTAGC